MGWAIGFHRRRAGHYDAKAKWPADVDMTHKSTPFFSTNRPESPAVDEYMYGFILRERERERFKTCTPDDGMGIIDESLHLFPPPILHLNKL